MKVCRHQHFHYYYHLSRLHVASFNTRNIFEMDRFLDNLRFYNISVISGLSQWKGHKLRLSAKKTRLLRPPINTQVGIGVGIVRSARKSFQLTTSVPILEIIHVQIDFTMRLFAFDALKIKYCLQIS